MALAKVMGIETEYGISSSDRFADPVVTSTLLVNAYAQTLDHHIAWDFEDEAPHRDARGATRASSRAPMVERHLANTVLTNGARFYVDHAHPEYSSPECRSPLEAVLYDVAGELILRDAMDQARSFYPEAPDIVVYKNNSDAKGQSYGCHENYLLDRSIPFDAVANAVIPHFISRQIYCGAGKVGQELVDAISLDRYQISQRAEFFEAVIGLETTIKRPIVNTRDEPHADSSRFRRLHVIIGDANCSQVATFLKLSTTALILAMLEDRALPETIGQPLDPVHAVHVVSQDPSLHATIATDRGDMTALEIQFQYLEAAEHYLASADPSFLGDSIQAAMALRRWREALEGLEADPDSMASTIDWVAKRRLLHGFAQRHDLAPTNPKLQVIDLQYHDLRPERSLALRAGLEEIVTASDARAATTRPPEETRAWFRGTALSRFPEAVVTANWDSVVFDVGEDPLRRVPMMDPLRGGKAATESIFESASSAKHLIALLAQEKG